MLETLRFRYGTQNEKRAIIQGEKAKHLTIKTFRDQRQPSNFIHSTKRQQTLSNDLHSLRIVEYQSYNRAPVFLKRLNYNQSKTLKSLILDFDVGENHSSANLNLHYVHRFSNLEDLHLRIKNFNKKIYQQIHKVILSCKKLKRLTLQLPLDASNYYMFFTNLFDILSCHNKDYERIQIIVTWIDGPENEISFKTPAWNISASKLIKSPTYLDFHSHSNFYTDISRIVFGVQSIENLVGLTLGSYSERVTPKLFHALDEAISLKGSLKNLTILSRISEEVDYVNSKFFDRLESICVLYNKRFFEEIIAKGNPERLQSTRIYIGDNDVKSMSTLKAFVTKFKNLKNLILSVGRTMDLEDLFNFLIYLARNLPQLQVLNLHLLLGLDLDKNEEHLNELISSCAEIAGLKDFCLNVDPQNHVPEKTIMKLDPLKNWKNLRALRFQVRVKERNSGELSRFIWERIFYEAASLANLRLEFYNSILSRQGVNPLQIATLRGQKVKIYAGYKSFALLKKLFRPKMGYANSITRIGHAEVDEDDYLEIYQEEL